VQISYHKLSAVIKRELNKENAIKSILLFELPFERTKPKQKLEEPSSEALQMRGKLCDFKAIFVEHRTSGRCFFTAPKEFLMISTLNSNDFMISELS
jgi:hypothetical protein